MAEDCCASNGREDNPQESAKRSVEGNGDGKPRWTEIVKAIESFPLKALSGIAAAIGACIVVAYYVHIEYLPNLDAVNIPFLFGQVFYTGMLTCLVLLSLFVTVFFGSSSALKDLTSGHACEKKIKVLYFVELILVHFPLILIIDAQDRARRFGYTAVSSWWGVIAWAVLFGGLFAYRHYLMRRIGGGKEQKGKMPTEADVVKAVPIDLKRPTGEKSDAKEENSIGSSGRRAEESRKAMPYVDEGFTFSMIALSSALPIYVLAVILDFAPVSAKMDMMTFWMAWALLATMNALLSLATNITIGQKFMMACGVLFVVLSISRLTHLPVVLAVRLAGVGQIGNTDIELSNSRCLIVRKQLVAAELNDRLTCPPEANNEVGKVPSKLEIEASINSAGVLKDVLILNRIGTELYVELPVGEKIPARASHVSGQTAVMPANDPMDEKKATPDKVAVGSSATQVEMSSKAETEPVVRLRIPKSDANELVRLDKPIASRAFFGERKQNQPTSQR